MNKLHLTTSEITPPTPLDLKKSSDHREFFPYEVLQNKTPCQKIAFYNNIKQCCLGLKFGHYAQICEILKSILFRVPRPKLWDSEKGRTTIICSLQSTGQFICP